MITKSIATALFWLILISSSGYAQLGTKDGSGLAPTDLDRVKVGQPAPDFSLTEMNGKQISLSQFRGKKNVVLVFYRGHW